MLTQNLSGQFKECPNRLCHAPFTRECHIGTMAKSPLEIYAVMRCPKCGDLFKISQILSIAHEYKKKLPAQGVKAKQPGGPITFAEMKTVRQRLDTEKDPLKSLFNSLRPGSGCTSSEE